MLKELAGEDLHTDKPKWGTAVEAFATREEGEKACRAIYALSQMLAINTLLNTFIHPLPATADANGRVHASFNLNTEVE